VGSCFVILARTLPTLRKQPLGEHAPPPPTPTPAASSTWVARPPIAQTSCHRCLCSYYWTRQDIPEATHPGHQNRGKSGVKVPHLIFTGVITRYQTAAARINATAIRHAAHRRRRAVSIRTVPMHTVHISVYFLLPPLPLRLAASATGLLAHHKFVKRESIVEPAITSHPNRHNPPSLRPRSA
jgi:hypothetical protein